MDNYFYFSKDETRENLYDFFKIDDNDYNHNLEILIDLFIENKSLRGITPNNLYNTFVDYINNNETALLAIQRGAVII